MANLQETSTWEAGIYQLETSDPVMGGENGIDNRAPRQLANRTLWLKNELAKQIGRVNQADANLVNQKADKATQLTAGAGLTGGGDLSTSRSLSLGTPSTITAATTNTAVSNTHTHAIDKASTTTQGIVQLNSSVSSTSTTQAATPSAVKVAYDQATAANHNADGRVSKTGNETISGVKTFTDEITVTSSNALRFKNTNLTQSVFFRFSGTHFFLMKTAPNDPEGNWDASRPMVWDTTTDTLTLRGQLYGNATTATKLATPRTISATGDATWSVNFDGSNSVSGALTLTNTGVTAGSYNAVTVDAKGRMIRGLNQTISLVTATTASTTSNQATSNGNTYLNIVNRGAGISAAGSSTKITGTNGITVSSDASGALTISQDLANHLTSSSTTQALSAAQGKILNDTKLDKTNVITNPTLLTDGDLNDYTQPGYYYCPTNHQAASIVNTPTNLAFCLQVVKASGVIQTVRQYSSSYTWMRGYANGHWSSWQRFALTTDNAPTATKLATPRSIRLSGDVTAATVFDGSQDINLVSSIH
ncbi:hypothetical protein D6D69_01410 [Moraxella catarrhalis]|uniref:pyocin knob domain-containing protein n=1 Tax=Moraxella catarrhalis TaxID=480 RepID=UPI0007E2E095|nr:pyocin knob domain-containing protein [Moraxella catarrhalis]OAV09533.1 Phage tail fiber protein [Moraxella catarrhalis]RKM24097.1 hypothetical protein D6D69_01410 [Moraxella catarrhalis]